ncbi:MAG TPA: DUF6159 family protein [Longimicrobium sp.]|nr:DUF6159 family protein [Longimicrobium sp.]
MSFSQLRPLSFGEILDGSFTLYRRHFASMFLTALIPHVPYIAWLGLYSITLLGAANTSAADPTAVFGSMLGVLALLPLVLICTVIGWGAVTFQVSRAYTGNPVGTGEALRRGLQRALPLIGGGIVWSMMVGVGWMLCFIPAVLVLIMTFAWVPAVVLERRGPIEAIQRSMDLAKNTWGEIFLMQLVVWLITLLPGMAVAMFGMMSGGGMASLGGGAGSISAVQVITQVLSGLVNALTIPFSIGCTVLLYYDRRVRTEALDVQMMAESLNADGSYAGGYPAGGYAAGGYPAGGYPAGGSPAGDYGPPQGYPYASGGSGFTPPGYGNAPIYRPGPAHPGYPGGQGQGGGPGYPGGGPGHGGSSYAPPPQGGPAYPTAPGYPGAPEYPAGPASPGPSSGEGGGAQPPRGRGHPETPAGPDGE